jgi:ribosome-binding factor A
MESTRQKKVSRLIQKDLGEIFQRESRNLFEGALITVTQVRISPDLSWAKVYVSLFGAKDNQKLLQDIKDRTKEIRVKLAEKVKKQLRVVPNLDFHLDDSLDYAEKIDNLLKK